MRLILGMLLRNSNPRKTHTIEPFYCVELDIFGLNIEREQLEAGHSHGISGGISCRAHSHMTVPIWKVWKIFYECLTKADIKYLLITAPAITDLCIWYSLFIFQLLDSEARASEQACGSAPTGSAPWARLPTLTWTWAPWSATRPPPSCWRAPGPPAPPAHTAISQQVRKQKRKIVRVKNNCAKNKPRWSLSLDGW